MGASLIRFGVLVIALDVALLFFTEFYLEIKIYPLVHNIGLAGLGMIALGFVFRLFGKTSRVIKHKKSHCVRCGVKLLPGSLYCKKHADEAAEEFRAESLTRKRR